MGYTDSNLIRRRLGDQQFKLTLAQLKAAVPDRLLEEGAQIQLSDGRIFVYQSACILTADDVFVVQPTSGPGRYLLAPGHMQHIELPFAFGTADAAVLATTPTNFFGRIHRGYWRITADMTGGASSAIGISSGTATGFTTKGDFHGGAAGDVLATLVAGKKLGTVGAKIAAGASLGSADTIRFDRITSAFTAGSGFAGIIIEVIDNPGA